MVFLAVLTLNLIGLFIFAWYYDKRDLVLLAVMSLLALASLYYWPLAGVFVVPLLLPLVKKMRLSTTAIFCMPSTIALSWFVYNLSIPSGLALFTAYFSVIAISALGIHTLFQDDVQKFLAQSNLIQFVFVVLDMNIAVLTGKQLLKTIQIFNYSIAGLLLFIALGMLARHRRSFAEELMGAYYEDRWNGGFATLSAISLAGIPLLNVFVSEWYMFIASFAIDPAISLLGIFAALVLFILYFKIAYILLAGESEHRGAPPVLTGFNFLLCLSMFVLAVPQTQLFILGVM